MPIATARNGARNGGGKETRASMRCGWKRSPSGRRTRPRRFEEDAPFVPMQVAPQSPMLEGMNDLPPMPKGAGGPADPLVQAAALPREVESPTVAPAVVPAGPADPTTAAPPLDPAASAPPETAAAAEPSISASPIGVLLVNLGTPDAAEPKAVRRYLKEFLSDPRVIEKNSLLWKCVLNGIILPLRSRRRARDYMKIWSHEHNESPLKTITRAQAEKLAVILEPLGKHVIVDWAMRYANPSIASRLQAMVAAGCERVLVMPLYPQYAAATTATACDEIFRLLMTLRRQPAVRILPAYYADPAYLDALASTLKAALQALPFAPQIVLASYHGMPLDYVRKGDPYASQCERTTQLLRERTGLDENRLMHTYQSRFGRGRWLEPYTIETVKALAKRGVKSLAVITPGFAADCLETLEEIAIENARVFKRYGGENFAVVPCLNDSEAGMRMIGQLAMRELKGWV
jgi:ferrochelatase